jgi:hypothetical protein
MSSFTARPPASAPEIAMPMIVTRAGEMPAYTAAVGFCPVTRIA